MTQTGATDGAQARDDQIDLDDLQEWGKADPGADDGRDAPASRRPYKTRRWRKWWAGSLVALLLIQQILGIVVRTIPLERDNNNVDWVIFIVAGAATAGWIFGNRNFFDLSPVWRWLVAVATGIPFAIAVLIVTLLAAEKIVQFFDFPPGKTHQSMRLFRIDQYDPVLRTVRLAGRDRSVRISETDFKRMLAAFDKDPGSYYCLRALAQQHGEAVRIMHDEAEDFPTGSIVRCAE